MSPLARRMLEQQYYRRPMYEFMAATQGSHTDGIELDATPGRTGSYGWTEREQMMRPGKPQ